MVLFKKYFLFINDDITKKQMDEVIEKVNINLEQDNSIWYLTYDGFATDEKYFLSFEIRKGVPRFGDERFFSFRNSQFQFEKKYFDLNNKKIRCSKMPDDFVMLSTNDNKKYKIKRGLKLYCYTKNISSEDFKYLFDTLNIELDKIGCSIKKIKVETNNLVPMKNPN